jgi:hypothetical protein
MNQTDLKFYLNESDNCFLPMGSIRGCKQTLEPLSAPVYRRALDGQLVVIKKGIDKYQCTLMCEDIICPSFEKLIPGTSLWIECIQRFTTPLLKPEEKLTLKRSAVPNSFFLITPGKKPIALEVKNPKCIELSKEQEGYVSYRPLLNMMLMDLRTEMDEWENRIKWKMVLEEI